LAEVLNSKARPDYWKRSFDSSDYDTNKLGWKYENLDNKLDKATYDTSLPGYGNGGHKFGDDLTEEERSYLIEYLKTL